MINSIISKLTASADAIASVSGPVAISAVDRDDYPAAIVYPVSDAPDVSSIGPYSLMRSRVAVEISADGLDSLNSAKASARQALFGFKPTGAVTVLALASGQMKSIDGSRVIWVDTWECKTCG